MARTYPAPQYNTSTVVARARTASGDELSLVKSHTWFSGATWSVDRHTAGHAAFLGSDVYPWTAAGERNARKLFASLSAVAVAS